MARGFLASVTTWRSYLLQRRVGQMTTLSDVFAHAAQLINLAAAYVGGEGILTLSEMSVIVIQGRQIV
eukprot:7208036-Karenia_brevis.AAC.1